MHVPSSWHHGLVADYWAGVNLDALWVSRLHELDPPRRYPTVVCSGVLGLGSIREQDVRALGELSDALLPGGALVLDNEERPFRWRARDWNEPSDGEISLCSRVDAVDEDDRCVHMTIRAEARDGRREEHALTMRQWYPDELVPLLRDAGFASVAVNPGIDEHTLVYVATRPAVTHDPHGHSAAPPTVHLPLLSFEGEQRSAGSGRRRSPVAGEQLDEIAVRLGDERDPQSGLGSVAGRPDRAAARLHRTRVHGVEVGDHPGCVRDAARSAAIGSSRQRAEDPPRAARAARPSARP